MKLLGQKSKKNIFYLRADFILKAVYRHLFYYRIFSLDFSSFSPANLADKRVRKLSA